ncbi:MAG: hypothetical protein JRN52_11375 [Nitrososphaerota archaeon]|nr:hypothetical protein [Nitrososphaerota archaeon]
MRRVSKKIEDLTSFLCAAGLLAIVAVVERGALGISVVFVCSALSVKWFRDPVTTG